MAASVIVFPFRETSIVMDDLVLLAIPISWMRKYIDFLCLLLFLYSFLFRT